MNSLKVSTRLYLLVGLCMVVMALQALVTWSSLTTLREMQDNSFRRAQDSGTMKHASGMGAELYRVIADTYINQHFDEAARSWREISAAADKELAEATAIADTPEEKRLMDEAARSLAEIRSIYENQFLPLVRQGGRVEEVRRLDDRIDNLVDSFDKALNTVAVSLNSEAEESDKAFDASADSTLHTNLFMIALSAVILVVVALLVARSVTQQLGCEPAEAVSVTRRIAAGDLGSKVTPRPGDTDSLLVAVHTMQEGLRGMIGEVINEAESLAGNAETLQQTAENVLGRSQKQSDAAQAIAAAVEEMNVSIEMISRNAGEARDVAVGSVAVADEGGSVIQAAGSEVERLASAVNDSAAKISELERHSTEITSVVNVIREIAEQTNLLALNAAIEAARAGEQGRGFAVVADEVRKLAERTSTSTNEIGTTISRIQGGTREAVASMESGVAQAKQGVALAGDAGKSIVRIREGVKSVTDAISAMNDSIKEQSAASGEIAVRVEQIARMTEESAADIAKTTEAARGLQAMSRALHASVARFRLA